MLSQDKATNLGARKLYNQAFREQPNLTTLCMLHVYTDGYGGISECLCGRAAMRFNHECRRLRPLNHTVCLPKRLSVTVLLCSLLSCLLLACFLSTRDLAFLLFCSFRASIFGRSTSLAA